MKKLILSLIIAILAFSPVLAMAQTGSIGDYPLGKKGWMFGISTGIPVMKIVESDAAGAQMDVLPVAGFGAGFQIYYTDVNVIDHKKILSITLPMLFMSTRLDDEKKLDLTVAAMAGILDDLLSFGIGYETGAQPYPRSRWVGLLSFGVKF